MMMRMLFLCVFFCGSVFAQQGWYPHEGGLLKYRVQIRFGEEPDTMPEGWKFGRVSAVAVDSAGNVYVSIAARKPTRSSSSIPKESTCAPGARACSAILTGFASTRTTTSGSPTPACTW